jgi:hypothetical protein
VLDASAPFIGCWSGRGFMCGLWMHLLSRHDSRVQEGEESSRLNSCCLRFEIFGRIHWLLQIWIVIWHKRLQLVVYRNIITLYVVLNLIDALLLVQPTALMFRSVKCTMGSCTLVCCGRWNWQRLLGDLLLLKLSKISGNPLVWSFALFFL